MKALTERILHYLVLVAVTAFAIGMMWYLSAKQQRVGKHSQPRVRPLSTVAAPKALVAIEPLQVQTCEISSTYAGKIQAWETYQVGFEVSGRVFNLGENEAGASLDDGDHVVAGQVLAVLDDRVFRARKSEATAQVEQATADLRRAEQIRATNPTALTESELQRLVTEVAMARAQQEVAIKNLEDTTLTAPVDATISKRMLKTGESVSAHQIIFELVENEEVLLVVDVPESHIRELEARMRTVEKNLTDSNDQLEDEDRVFRAHVQLEGRDRFGTAWPPLLGEVHRIAEVAHPRTGLFSVEIRLANAKRLLRPGMVATADVVTARIPGYRVPEASVLFRQRRAHLFSVVKEPTEMEMLYWNLGPVDVYRARRIDLVQWIDQGEHIVLPADTADLDSVVVRGHFRLANSQVVRVVNLSELSPGEIRASAPRGRVSVASGEKGHNDPGSHDQIVTKSE